MRGQTPTLKDIILTDIPDVVSLYCDEQLLDSSEEEDNGDCLRDQPAKPAQLAYRVVTECGLCSRPVRLAVLCGVEDLRKLQQLMVEAVAIVCPGCA